MPTPTIPMRVHVTEPTQPLSDRRSGVAVSADRRRGVRMIQVGRGCFDAMPVSVVSGLTALESARRCVGPGRFRINLVVGPDARDRVAVGR
jgi:hypothetical protein